MKRIHLILAGSAIVSASTIFAPAEARPLLLPAAQVRCEVVGSVVNTVYVDVGGYFTGQNGGQATYIFTNTATGAVLTYSRNTVPQNAYGFPIPAGTWTIDTHLGVVGGKPVTVIVPKFIRVGARCMPDLPRARPEPDIPGKIRPLDPNGDPVKIDDSKPGSR